MFEHLQIYERRERLMVGLADVGLSIMMGAVRAVRRPPSVAAPQRILLLRLERIGDLLMSWPAIAALRRMAPDARIDLVVGSWNEPIARLLDDVSRVETLDARWLSRGAAAHGVFGLIRQSRRWRSERYDWAINFEGDIRSHLVMACSGAPRRIGFDMAGGGPLLTDRVSYDASSHVADNLLRLVDRAFENVPFPLSGATREPAPGMPLEQRRLPVPETARKRAGDLLAELLHHRPAPDPAKTGSGGPPSFPLIGIQVSGGRRVKQWDPARFGDVGARLVTTHGARLVFTGSVEDRPLVDAAIARLPPHARVADVCGRADLLTLAAILERLSVFVTGDTGPMHLAAAVGTPLVAIFGPSDPRRWGPLSSSARIVLGRIECRPCNRIRRPPARCAGAMPDCLAAVGVDEVVAATGQMLAAYPRGEAAMPPRGAMPEAGDVGR